MVIRSIGSSAKLPARSTRQVRNLLSDILTPDLYDQNPFRILGLPTTASPLATDTQIEKRLVLAELGKTDHTLDGPFPLRPLPTLEDLRKAEINIHDPVRRIVHEMFWFWPLDGIDGFNDPGFLALRAGDVPTASKIWSQAFANPTTAPIARHNNAVRWHFTALFLEKQRDKLTNDDVARERYHRFWKGALVLWEEVLGNDVTWAAVSARAQILTPDLKTPEFLRDLRACLAEAFMTINATLAAKHCSEGRPDLAKIQFSLFLANKHKTFQADLFAQAAIARLKANLGAFVQEHAPGIEGNEPIGADIAISLIEGLRAYCSCFEDLEHAAGDNSWRTMVDEVIRTANLYAIAYVEKTRDNPRFTSILRAALPFVSDNELFSFLNRNISNAVGTMASAYLQPYFGLLKSSTESTASPKTRFEHLQVDVISHLPQIRERLNDIGYPINEFLSATVVVLRGISEDAWSKRRDGATAHSALDLADEFVRDRKLAEAIKSDRSDLLGLIAESKRARRRRIQNRVWGAAAVAVVLLLVGYAKHYSDTHNAPPPNVPAPALQLQTDSAPR